MPALFRRRWFRFSLRGLLIVTALASIWLGWRVKKVRDADAAVAAVKQAGGGMFLGQVFRNGSGTMIAGFPPRARWRRIVLGEEDGVWVVSFNNHFNELTDKRLIGASKALARVGGRLWLSDNGTQITNASLEHVAHISNLEQLDMISSRITDPGVVHLQALSQLKFLNLPYARVSPDARTRLRESLPKCEMFIGGVNCPPLRP